MESGEAHLRTGLASASSRKIPSILAYVRRGTKSDLEHTVANSSQDTCTNVRYFNSALPDFEIPRYIFAEVGPITASGVP